MKFLVFILAATILFLAVKPGIASFSQTLNTQQCSCEDKCSDHEEDSSPKKEDNGPLDSEKPCNCLQSCCAPVLFCSGIQAEHLAKPLFLLAKKNFPYQSRLISHFTSEFWQPPRIV